MPPKQWSVWIDHDHILFSIGPFYDPHEAVRVRDEWKTNPSNVSAIVVANFSKYYYEEGTTRRN